MSASTTSVPAARLPIWRLVTLSYVDLWRALRAMPVLFGCAVLIVLAVRVASQLLPHRLETGPLSGLIEDAVRYFCLTPIMIATHRFIIRGDVTRSYTIDFADQAFWPFFAWTLVLSILFTLVDWVDLLLPGKTGAGHNAIMSFAILTVIFAAAIWFSLRLIVLFPAIAVRAPGARAANALADTKGYGARLFAILFLAFIPPIVIGILITLALGRGLTVRGSVQFVIGDVTTAVMATLVQVLGVVVASHIYLAIGRTVR
jgi:hypothetical protein